MTCAQGLLCLLWGGGEVGVLRDCLAVGIAMDVAHCGTSGIQQGIILCLGNEFLYLGC